jgi:nucleotide-binding universal stress UspA family protein
MTANRAILHPTDFSEYAQQAFRVACSLAKDRDAKLILLHVVPKPLTTLGGTQGLPPQSVEYDLSERRTHLAAFKAPEGVTVERRLHVGDEVEGILRAAQETGCELIVMGTHGRTGLNRLLMGSVAEQVVRRAPCPVLTLRAESEHQATVEPVATVVG